MIVELPSIVGAGDWEASGKSIEGGCITPNTTAKVPRELDYS